MQNSGWVALLRLIPTVHHRHLMMLTTIGQEISVQDVLRLEEEYMVIRGRMSGTSDAGRVFLIPFDQINYLGFVNSLNEQDINAIFGGSFAVTESTEDRATRAAAIAAEAATQAAEAAAPPKEEPPPAPPPAAPVPAPTPTPAPEKPKPASKVVLLERVRARLAAAAKAKSQSSP